jgi:EpsI family protein
MAKKKFILILAILLITFVFAGAIKIMKPTAGTVKDLDQFPLEYDGWFGRLDNIDRATLDMLNPDKYFNATYANRQGLAVQLFFDYFGSGGSSGGVHSPRNCLPGSGWAILGVEAREITINGRTIPGSRFHLRLGETAQVMDFWYITRRGETSNDYKFKLYTMLSSLALQPTDVAFIRFVARDNPESRKALAEFEMTFVPLIYDYLPFN